jgi:hypothetical protein
MRTEQVRDLMRDIDQRAHDRAETTSRWIGVVVGLAIVFGAWLVPGYWQLRQQVLALPFFSDQWFLMALIGFVVMKLVQRSLTKRRFPYLDAATR